MVVGRWRKRQLGTANRNDISFKGDGNVLELDSIGDSQLSENTKTTKVYT